MPIELSQARPHGPDTPLPVELEPLRGWLPMDLLQAAARRAARLGVGGGDVLVAAGRIGREAYVRRCAAWLGLAFETFERSGRLAVPSPDAGALRTGFVPLGAGAAGPVLAVALRGQMLRGIAALLRRYPHRARNIRLTTLERLEAHVLKRRGLRLAEHAAFGLLHRAPELSAGSRPRPRRGRAMCVMLGGAALLWYVPDVAAAVCHVLLSLGFLGCIALRCFALTLPTGLDPPVRRVSERALPVYSLVVPLHREGRVVAKLLAALGKLDYPVEKLDILIVVEPDDRETGDALAAIALPSHIRIVVAPRRGPRTKPKALCAALPFVRGRFLVVYDAEDEPEPDQLRQAVQTFAGADPRLACVQARLAIYNPRDSLLTRYFAGEYAGQFDVFLPMLTATDLPVPLGGTSNHFRVDVLQQVGGWDPFNVTEDADLGIRLARHGWRTTVIGSTTWEEAPPTLAKWLRQRTRWFKGWIQTWLVHMRRPRRLLDDLGLWRVAGFQLVIGGSLLSALVHPLFLVVLVVGATDSLPASPDGPFGAVLIGLTAATLVSGYVASAALGIAGLARRRALSIAWVFVTMPLYWLLLSAAAWRAVWQFVVDPYLWEKTEHGLATTSVRMNLVRDGAGNRPPPPRADV